MKQSKSKKKWRVAEIELRYTPKVKYSERPKIKTSKDAYIIFMQTWDKEKINLLEQFKVILVNKGSRALGVSLICSGGISQTVADAKLIFGAALKGGASGVIVGHNHPSGRLGVSKSDLEITTKLEAIGKLLDLPLLDHLIVTSEQYLSFAEEGLLGRDSTSSQDSHTIPNEQKKELA